MKHYAISAAILLSMTACSNKTQRSSNTDSLPHEAAIGVNKDEHGCNAAAGETWSELKQTCVQIFNVGKRLDPVNVQKGEAVISAFALVSDDEAKVEIFLPSQYAEHSVILSKVGDGSYENGKYKYLITTSQLYIDGVEVYKAQ